MEKLYVCGYGAAGDKIDKIYFDECEKLGEGLASLGYGLVFGGGASGVMGALVRGVKKANGSAVGIAPLFFDTPGTLYKDCDEFIFTDTMSQRKTLLEDRSAAFVICPGGIGTMDEFFETLTLRQLGVHNKPIVVLNINGCYDLLVEFLDGLVKKNFLGQSVFDNLKVSNDTQDALAYLKQVLG